MTTEQQNDKLNIVIRNEQDAYDFLRKIYEKELGDDVSKLHIQFEGWPNVQVKLTGKKYQSTITPSIMKAFLKLQDGLYKAYALAVYADSKHRLTDKEKKSLELVIKVSQGSSDFFDNLDINETLNNLLQNMNSEHLLVAIIFGLLCYLGRDCYQFYLDSKKEAQAAELMANSKKESEEHLERMTDKLLAEQKANREFMQSLIQQKPELEEIAIEARETQREFFKQVSDADKIEIQGITVTGEEAKKLGTKPRMPPARQFNEIRLDGMYRIINVNTELESGFKVKIRNESSGQELIAEVQEGTFEEEYKQAIQNGTFEKRPVELTINAKQKVKDGSISDAVIIKAVLHQKQNNH